MSRFLRSTAFVPMVLALPSIAWAQTIRGIVVDGGNSGISGVVIMMLDSASRVVARAMTSGQGEFRVTAPRGGVYHLRTLRIGFRPTTSDAKLLRTGEEFSLRIELANTPVALDAVRTTSNNVCRAFTDSGAATYAVWQQVHAALTAADLTAGARAIVATTVAYERTLRAAPGSRNEIVADQTMRVSTGAVTRPWRELPADSLRRAGYVIAERDNSVSYFAPGFGVLLSDGFVEDHCFRLTTDPDSSTLIGITFEPSPDRKKLAEIRGTMWVDRSSAELRRLEFGYANVSPEEQQKAGGAVEFKRVRDGTWLISRWSIRMPVLEQVVQGSLGGFRSEARVSAIKVSGGDLALARRGFDTLWMRPPLVIHGQIRDSLTGAGLASARLSLIGTQAETVADDAGRFTLQGALPGEYAAEIRTRSLDSVNTAHRTPVMLVDSATSIEIRVPGAQQFVALVCGRSPKSQSTGGVILGSLVASDSTSRSFAGTRVTAEWATDEGSTRLRRTEVRAGADGSFRFCDLPLNLPVGLRARSDNSATAEPKLVLVSSAVRLARAELTVYANDDLAKRGAIFIGTVVSDSTNLPIAGAEVSLPELGKSTITDSVGRFRLIGIATGEQRVVVRRIGYGAADTKLTFAGFETIERRVVLGSAVTLQGVTVTAQATDRDMPGFEENKRVGLGRFLTRVDLEKYTGMKLGTVLDQLTDLSAMRGRGGQLWVASTRQPASLGGSAYYVPDKFEKEQGMKTACYAQVYIDRVLMNGVGEPTQPFDLTTVVPESVESIEWYAGASQTPLKYARMASNCGVLVIWTRRK